MSGNQRGSHEPAGCDITSGYRTVKTANIPRVPKHDKLNERYIEGTVCVRRRMSSLSTEYSHSI